MVRFKTAVVLCVTLVVPSIAMAGGRPGVWPTYAHDFTRSARTDVQVKGAMTAPTVAWTHHLGTSLRAGEAAFVDLDGDGRTDVATINGGRVVARDAAGKQLWTGPLDGASAILGAWNLNGVGAPELVIETPSGVDVLDGAIGSLDVTLPDIGNASSMGASFVPLGASGGILVVAAATDAAHAYDFRGTVHPTSALWSIATGYPTKYLVGDVDGDTVPDLVRPLNDGFDVLDPITGARKYGPLVLGPAYAYMGQLADLDSSPGQEIVAVDFSYKYSPSAGIYALGIRNGALATIWSSVVTATTALATDFFTVKGSVVDLDNDGSVEVAYSQWDGAQWTTHVVDGATGAVLGSTPGLVQALADIDGDGKVEVVIRSSPTADQTPVRSTLTAFDFDSRAIGLVQKPWSLPMSRVVTLATLDSSGVSESIPIPVTGDFDPSSPGLELLTALDATQANADTAFATVRADGSQAATLAIPPNSTLTAFWRDDKLTGALSVNDLLLFSDDGVMHVDSRSLLGTAQFEAGSFGTPFYVSALSTQSAAIFAPTSTNSVVWLDGTHLHTNGDPYILQETRSVAPSFPWGLGGWAFDPVVTLQSSTPLFVFYEQKDTLLSLVAQDATGIEVWRRPLAPGTRMTSPGSYVSDFTGDGAPDILVTLTNVEGLESLAIFDGVDGHLVRSTPLGAVEPGADLLSQGALVDVNGDGILDVIGHIQSSGTVAIDVTKTPMTALWLLPNANIAYDLGTIGAAPLANGTTELFRGGGNAGFGPYATISLAGSLLQSQDEGFNASPGNDTNHAALVTRGGGPNFDLVVTGMAAPVLSRVMRIAGDTLQPVWTVFAAQGAVSTSAPTSPVALHEPAEVDIDGDGNEDVVFGGDDGYVYALRAADGSLLFAVNIGAPVRFVIPADIDQDPAAELLASTMDGRLFALDDPGKYSATTDPSVDGGVMEAGEAGDADAGPDAGSGGGSGGCSCDLPEGHSSTGASGVLALVALALLRRRRS